MKFATKSAPLPSTIMVTGARYFSASIMEDFFKSRQKRHPAVKLGEPTETAKPVDQQGNKILYFSTQAFTIRSMLAAGGVNAMVSMNWKHLEFIAMN